MIRILDCTLRDGGYINNFEFGRSVIRSIVSKLADSNIEMIELGFLSDGSYDENKTFFPTLSDVEKIIGTKNPNVLYVGMIALGEKEISSSKIPLYDGRSIDAIRVTFHKNEITKAVSECELLKKKGYKVFMQPIGTTSYTDEEIITLIKKINKVKPYAFAIVDTLGSMYQNELIRLFHLFDHNLNKDIAIGFHSHNNLQLSFSNAQALLQLQSKREIIIDTSVFGMGRGAGNLCSELITRYINDNIEERYDVIPLLEIIENYLIQIYAKTPWGYSVPYYLSAVYGCHPNYASHLLKKQTISVNVIDVILKQIPNTERAVYNKVLVENIYQAHQNQVIDDKQSIKRLHEKLQGKSILVLAPGKSILEQQDEIARYIEEVKPILISVNFGFSDIIPDFVFVSNNKRYDANREYFDARVNLILTSNILEEKSPENHYLVNYSSLLNDNPSISDNAGMMLLNLLLKLRVKDIALAGFDGFSTKMEDNYFSAGLANTIDADELTVKNYSVKNFLDTIKREINLKFVTNSIYDFSNN